MPCCSLAAMTFRAPGSGPPTRLFPAPDEKLIAVRLPRARVPVTSVPIRLPWTRFPPPPPTKLMAAAVPEIRLPAPGAVPPIRLSAAKATTTPAPWNVVPGTSRWVPLASVPMSFPCTTVPPAAIEMPRVG